MAGLAFENAASWAQAAQEAVRSLVRTEGRAQLIAWAVTGAGIARARAPTLRTPDPDRSPGELRAAIGERSGETAGRPWAEFGVIRDLPEGYPFYVEFGTVHAAAQPFMRPACAELTQSAFAGARARAALASAKAARARVAQRPGAWRPPAAPRAR